jgi:hypothetical protein
MFRLLLIASVVCGAVACTEGRGPAVKSGPEARAPSQMMFLDSRIFDENLSGTMYGESQKITIDVPAGFTLNEIPERFDRWLYAVKESGGKVVAKPENPPKTRGIVSAVIDVVVAIAGKLDEMRLYQPSQQYDATLLYKEDGTVSKVVFQRRGE